MTRRRLFEDIVVAGALSPAMFAQAHRDPGSPDADSSNSQEFWRHFYDPPARDQRAPRLPAEERKVQFLYYSSAGPRPFRYAADIQREDLLDHPGDVAVSVQLGQFRPSVKDAEEFQRLQSVQFRVDCVQIRPLLNLLAPMGWTALASIFPDKGGQLPTLQALGFQTPGALSGVNKVVLPGGAGRMAVNVSMMKKDSILYTALKGVTKGVGIIAPLLNFPAISLPALKTFSDLYGVLEDRTKFLLNSKPVHAVATRQAWADPDRDETFVPLANGEYLLVPDSHTAELGKHLDNLTLQQGFLIDKDNNDQNLTPEKRAQQSVPNVTYISLRLSVAPLSQADLSQKPDTTDKGADSGKGAAQRPASKKK